MVNKVHFLGDSTLDNVFWTGLKKPNIEQAKADSIEGQLQKRLGNEYEVLNHAYDGFTTKNVLDQGTIGEVLFGYPFSDKFKAYAAIRDPQNKQIIQPLHELKNSIQANLSSKHFVVISVGGNDFRECLDNPAKLLTILPDVQKRYLEIVEKVQNLGPNVQSILMFQYPTSMENGGYNIYPKLGALGTMAAAINLISIGTIATIGYFFLRETISALFAATIGTLALALLATSLYLIPFKATIGILKGQHPGITVMGALMEQLYRPIIDYAQKHNLCMIDLPNTFNPFHTYLYISEIEPSKEGGAVIATLIAEAVKHPESLQPKMVRAKLNKDCDIQWCTSAFWTVDYPSRKS
jgi:hypothetical protein